jgi:ankyrin repeat protein
MALTAMPVRAAPPDDIAALIDKLAEVSAPDIGYSSSVRGETFAPLDAQGQVFVIRLFEKPLRRSDTMRQLVKHGLAALPHLLDHLGDRRPTPLRVEGEGDGPGGLFFLEGLDYNCRTDKPAAPNSARPAPAKKPRETSHTVTVGDLCMVAVGQIVNRDYDAVSHGPMAVTFVTSPTHTPALRDEVRKAWGSLTAERHRASLVADFLKPDDEWRRIGACKRLAYYYPDALEPLALQLLAWPTYAAVAIEEFVHEQLYREKDPRRCRALFDAYLARHGQGARDGIQLQLFDDLAMLEARENKWVSQPLPGFADQPRRLLIELYGKPKDVKSQDRPWVEALSDGARARLIDGGLVYDRSEKLDRAVRELLAASGDDDSLARACIRRLVGRGYDADIEEYLRRRSPHLKDKNDQEALGEVRRRLGWTRLHVAVDRNDLDTARLLARDKAAVASAGRDGQTPLHLAAAAGNLEAVTLLADAGAPLDAKDKAGLTAVQLAMRQDQLDVVRFLGSRGCQVPDVLVAAAVGRADRAEELLRADAGAAKVVTGSGLTPLHVAARSGQAGVARVLLARGLAVDAVDERGATALHVAAASGQAEVAEVLLEAKASPQARVKGSGLTPLHYAAFCGHAAVVKLLLAHKADPGAKDARGRTPLDLTLGAEEPEVVQLLEAAAKR